MFEAIAGTSQWQGIETFNIQQVANLAWLFAKFNHQAPSLFQALARAAHRRNDEFDPRALAKFAWALAVFDIEGWTDHESPFRKALQSTDPKSFDVAGLCQLHQFHLFCKERNNAH